jgi:hypothetical protein
LSQIHKLINSIRNKEELRDHWKETIIVPIYKKDDNAECSNYRGISLLSTSYKILSSILLSKLSPYIDGIIGGNKRVFWRNRVTAGQISWIYQIREKKNGSTMRQYISYS